MGTISKAKSVKIKLTLQQLLMIVSTNANPDACMISVPKQWLEIHNQPKPYKAQAPFAFPLDPNHVSESIRISQQCLTIIFCLASFSNNPFLFGLWCNFS